MLAGEAANMASSLGATADVMVEQPASARARMTSTEPAPHAPSRGARSLIALVVLAGSLPNAPRRVSARRRREIIAAKTLHRAERDAFLARDGAADQVRGPRAGPPRPGAPRVT